MTKKIKVIHIIKSLGRGGAERLLVETIAQHGDKYQFDVVYFLPWKDQLVKELELLGCTVYLLPAKKTPLMLFQLPRLIRLIRKNKYHLVHCHLPWAGIVGRIAGRITKVPVVYTEHNNFFSYNAVTRVLHKVKFNWFYRVIAVSTNAEEALRLAMEPLSSLQIILNGVNTGKFSRALFDPPALKKKLGISTEKLIISTVAVFRHQKRLDRWLHIAQLIIKQHQNIHFVIIGDGPGKEKIHELVRRLGLIPYVTLPGLLEDPRNYLACSDIYLMSSDYEGLPVALLEAMSMECVPVVTAVGGIPDVVQQCKNGFLYQPGEEQQAVEVIGRLKNNVNERKVWAGAARQTIQQRYSMTRMIRELEAVYQECFQCQNQ